MIALALLVVKFAEDPKQTIIASADQHLWSEYDNFGTQTAKGKHKPKITSNNVVRFDIFKFI
jgi:hypothetical protein